MNMPFDPTEPDPALPVDSQLLVRSMFTVISRDGSNPPEMNLTFDVEHAETGNHWRLGAHLSRAQIIELHALLHHACLDHGLIEPDA